MLVILTISCEARKIDDNNSVSQLMENLYKDMSGFTIDAVDTENVIKRGGAPTYGEITYEGREMLIKDLKPRKKDKFADLGAGNGKFPMHMLLRTPVKESIGVELSKTRFEQAQSAKKALEKEKKYTGKRKLEYFNDDIASFDLSGVTIAYMSSTCFSDDLMQKMTDKLAALKKGLRVLTLRQLSPNPKFKLEKEYKVPMTWSNDVTVYLYKLIK